MCFRVITKQYPRPLGSAFWGLRVCSSRQPGHCSACQQCLAQECGADHTLRASCSRWHKVNFPVPGQHSSSCSQARIFALKPSVSFIWNHGLIWVGKEIKDYLIPSPLQWAGIPWQFCCASPAAVQQIEKDSDLLKAKCHHCKFTEKGGLAWARALPQSHHSSLSSSAPHQPAIFLARLPTITFWHKEIFVDPSGCFSQPLMHTVEPWECVEFIMPWFLWILNSLGFICHCDYYFISLPQNSSFDPHLSATLTVQSSFWFSVVASESLRRFSLQRGLCISGYQLFPSHEANFLWFLE